VSCADRSLANGLNALREDEDRREASPVSEALVEPCEGACEGLLAMANLSAGRPVVDAAEGALARPVAWSVSYVIVHIRQLSDLGTGLWLKHIIRPANSPFLCLDPLLIRLD
jgi:hypothetical protein